MTLRACSRFPDLAYSAAEEGYGIGTGFNSDALFIRFQRLAVISHPVVTIAETIAVGGPEVGIDLHRLAALLQSLWIVSSNLEQHDP